VGRAESNWAVALPFCPYSPKCVERGILRNPFARSCIALILGCQKRPMAPVLRIEASTASWGAACIYIVVNRVGAFIPVSSATATLLLQA
jgi:hypothetical protein